MTGLSTSIWGTVDVMPLVVQLLGRDGKPLRRLPDPAGGTFDAAGDFDRLIEDSAYPTLSAIDLYAETIWHSSSMPALLADIEAALPWRRTIRSGVACCDFRSLPSGVATTTSLWLSWVTEPNAA